jgi:hypothetical protein
MGLLKRSARIGLPGISSLDFMSAMGGEMKENHRINLPFMASSTCMYSMDETSDVGVSSGPMPNLSLELNLGGNGGTCDGKDDLGDGNTPLRADMHDAMATAPQEFEDFLKLTDYELDDFNLPLENDQISSFQFEGEFQPEQEVDNSNFGITAPHFSSPVYVSRSLVSLISKY